MQILLLARKTLLGVIARKVRIAAPSVDLGEVEAEVEALLDPSVATEGYAIREDAEGRLVDLSRLDVEALRARVASAHGDGAAAGGDRADAEPAR